MAKPIVAVVDDEPSLCRSLSRLLLASGYEAVAYHSAEALLKAKTRRRIDCLVLDIQLGGMSGLELLEHLTASGCTTPVVFITAFDEQEKRERALQAGCAGYLDKSDPGYRVIAVIREAIAASRQTRKRLREQRSVEGREE